ncbi:MAG: hypothetical protein PWP37_715 [Thermotogota bacterium]|nr:hypothetical protein [Thermotogota bacterium]
MRMCLAVEAEHFLEVLDVLNELGGIEDHELIGMGAGALLPAMIRAHGGLARLRRYVLKEREKLREYFSVRNTLNLEGMVRSLLATLMKRVASKPVSKLKEHIREVLKGVTVENVHVLAFDITTGEEKELVTNRENCFDVLAAAISFPPLYEPVKIGDSLFCSLAYMTGIPGKGDFDFLVMSSYKEENDLPRSAIAIMERADRLRTKSIMDRRLSLYKRVIVLGEENP